MPIGFPNGGGIASPSVLQAVAYPMTYNGSPLSGGYLYQYYIPEIGRWILVGANRYHICDDPRYGVWELIPNLPAAVTSGSAFHYMNTSRTHHYFTTFFGGWITYSVSLDFSTWTVIANPEASYSGPNGGTGGFGFMYDTALFGDLILYASTQPPNFHFYYSSNGGASWSLFNFGNSGSSSLSDWMFGRLPDNRILFGQQSNITIFSEPIIIDPGPGVFFPSVVHVVGNNNLKMNYLALPDGRIITANAVGQVLFSDDNGANFSAQTLAVGFSSDTAMHQIFYDPASGDIFLNCNIATFRTNDFTDFRQVNRNTTIPLPGFWGGQRGQNEYNADAGMLFTPQSPSNPCVSLEKI